jgi:tetratricopeptide (TPR) repeat protein
LLDARATARALLYSGAAMQRTRAYLAALTLGSALATEQVSAVEPTPVRGASGTGEASRAERLLSYASSSGRPAPCVGQGSAQASLWARARFPESSRLCAALLLGSARLTSEPKAARELGLEAVRIAGDRPEPWVLLGRSQQLLGEPAEAAAAFERALQLDARALDAPSVLLSAARADVRLGKSARALDRYRPLASRVSLLSDQREQQRALIEAAVVSQVVSKDNYAEARAYAAEARRAGALFFVDFARASMALALDRMGKSTEARAIAAEAGGPRTLSWLIDSEAEPKGRVGENRPVLPLGEEHALVAILAEPVDRELARAAWSEYVEQAEAAPESSPWPAHLLAHAKKRLRELGG